MSLTSLDQLRNRVLRISGERFDMPDAPVR